MGALGRLAEHAPIRMLAVLARQAGVELYLVGGCVRDTLLDRQFREYDLVLVGELAPFLSQAAHNLKAALVPLDPPRGIYRLVAPSSTVFDFSSCAGRNLEADLAKRDFSINAMAVSVAELVGGRPHLLDSHQGLSDLSKRQVRALSAENLEADPLRLLRAFRLAAVLNFSVEENTLKLVRERAELLKGVSVERVRDEIFKMLSVKNAHPWLAMMDQTGILDPWLPEILPMKKTNQDPRFHAYDVWAHALETVRQVETLFQEEPVPGFDPEALIAGERTRGGWLKLVALFHDIGKPDTRQEDETGRVRFHDHEEVGGRKIAALFKRLRLSRREVNGAEHVVRLHLRPGQLARSSRTGPGAIPRLLREASPHAPDLLTLSLADARAKGKQDVRILTFLESLLRERWPEFQKQSEEALLRGRDLLKLGIPSGPQVGKILKSVEEMRLSGILKTRQEALRYVREKIIGAGSSGPDANDSE